ncbi:uncharacterized protein C1orf105 homolog [Gorilla gorilla gorilla]|uniref:Chromosome 1 open reading frame 105 n=1 Tax=Gorilla gorilla gorilla TaxID=9595 RepID=G3QVA0_GORGO|nr:uncharacterized protein C1orf105 homolog [Gorilla gorilla gorilla]
MEEMRPAGHGISNVCITFTVACHSCLPRLFNALIPSPDRNGAALLGGQASADSKSEARRNQCDSMLLRNQQLCSTCQEMKMVQPRTMKIPDDPKASFENCMSYRMSLHQPKFQTTPEPFHDDIPTESIHYRLPILGSRTSVFHGLLTEAYKTLKERQRSSLTRKEPIGKTMRH